MNLEQLLANAKTLQAEMQAGSVTRDVLMRHGQDIVEQQRIQLLEGKSSKGEDIHPFYTEDIKPFGYFRTRESARRYAAWKETLSYPYSVKRNTNAPNLYVTGVFHNDLNVDFRADGVAIVPDTAYAANIMRKYGNDMFGLCAQRWHIIFDEKGAKEEVIQAMKNILWQ